MSLNDVLRAIKKSFVPRKNVDFEDNGIHFELETLNATEDVKVLEACKDLDGSQYIEGLKRNSLAFAIKLISMKNEDGTKTVYALSEDFIDVLNESTGKSESKSKFLYMVDFLSTWPADVIDVLFEAFSDMVVEAREKVKKSAKFERFKISEKPAEDKPEALKRVTESEEESVEELDDNERLKKKVDRELEEADRAIYEAQDKKA
jgi:hypothetical protein